MAAVHVQSEPAASARRHRESADADRMGTRRSRDADFCRGGLSKIDQRFEARHRRRMRASAGNREIGSVHQRSPKLSRIRGEAPMHLMWFTERQYHYDPEEEPARSHLLETQILRNRSFFGLPNKNFDPEVGSMLINQYIDEKVYSEDLGFDGLTLI